MIKQKKFILFLIGLFLTANIVFGRSEIETSASGTIDIGLGELKKVATVSATPNEQNAFGKIYLKFNLTSDGVGYEIHYRVWIADQNNNIIYEHTLIIHKDPPVSTNSTVAEEYIENLSQKDYNLWVNNTYNTGIILTRTFEYTIEYQPAELTPGISFGFYFIIMTIAAVSIIGFNLKRNGVHQNH